MCSFHTCLLIHIEDVRVLQRLEFMYIGETIQNFLNRSIIIVLIYEL